MNKIFVLLILGTLVLSACGPEPEPTMSVEEIQGTAVAGAFTMIAETQAALPTVTPAQNASQTLAIRTPSHQTANRSSYHAQTSHVKLTSRTS